MEFLFLCFLKKKKIPRIPSFFLVTNYDFSGVSRNSQKCPALHKNRKERLSQNEEREKLWKEKKTMLHLKIDI